MKGSAAACVWRRCSPHWRPRRPRWPSSRRRRSTPRPSTSRTSTAASTSADNFIELGPFGGTTSYFIFTSAAPIASLSLAFRFSGALDGDNGTVSLSRVFDDGMESVYHQSTLGDTPGNYSNANPGLLFSGG